MAIFLRQSTASQEVPLGYFVDSTDGDTEETGLTIANTDIKLWKTGATTLANKNSGGGTHISNGVYYAVLDATDTNTLGPLVIFCHVSGALAVRVECCVLAANVYDSLIAGSDTLNAAVTEWNGVALATTNPLPNAAPDAAGGLPVSDAGGLDLDGMNTNVSAILTDTADMQPKLGTPAGASISADIAAIDTEVGQILADTGTDGVVVDWSAIVNPTATKSFTNTTIAVTSAVTGNVGGNVTGSIGSLAAQAKADVNAEVDAALDTAVPGTPTAGSINDILKDLDALLPGSGTLSTLDAAAVNAEVVDALATDTYAEPGSVPAAAASLAAKIGWLYLLSRNKVTQTATTTTVRNDADSGSVATSTVSDDGTTFTRGEWS